ncbi:MAG TPA: RNA methyltransferase [Acidimicrobiales bacterium]|nr:RNA methyltransferase [Acidimicrobiales bacterium]
MAEGVRVIGQLLEAGWPVVSVLLTSARAAARPDLVAGAQAAGAAVYTADQEVFDGIAGFHVHRGALALARRPAARSVGEVVVGARLVLVIEGVNDHENIGSLFRNAAAFGVGAVVLDPTAADPLYRRAVRVSLGHVIRIPFARAPAWPAALDELRAAGFRVVALTPDGSAGLDEVPSGSPLAVLVGAEGDGLSAAARQAADMTVRIPMADGADSLNVATAAAVALFGLSARA